MRSLALSGCLFALVAAVFLLVGHTGAPELRWLVTPVSTFAARAPNGAWATASMISAAAVLGCLGLLVAQHHLLGKRAAPKVVTLLAGAGIGGLVLLAVFKEAPGTPRQQAHEAGLLCFLLASWLAMVVSGAFVVTSRRPVGWRVLGAAVAVLAPVSFVLMSRVTPLPSGLRQRLGLASLWLAMVLLLGLALRDAAAPAPRRALGR